MSQAAISEEQILDRVADVLLALANVAADSGFAHAE